MGKMIAYTGIGYSGRTTVILNKASLLVKEGYKVLVVDADQTKSNVRATLNLEPTENGMQQAVTSLDEMVFNDCFIYDKKTKLTFLTLPLMAKYDDLFLLTSKQAENFYRKVKKKYDYILIDCGSIHYEYLSAVSLFEADKICIILPPEKRAAIWFSSNKNLFSNFEKVDYTIINLTESPEIPQDQIYEKSQYIEIPYISNMRDYVVMGDLFIQNPTGKQAQEYVNTIRSLVSLIKEL